LDILDCFWFLDLKTLTWTHEYIKKYLSLDFKTKLMTIFMWNCLGMESFEVNPFMTQDIESEFVANNMLTKAHLKKERPQGALWVMYT